MLNIQYKYGNVIVQTSVVHADQFPSIIIIYIQRI